VTPGQRIGANVKALREAAGLTQEDLAWRAQLHRTQVTMVETGKNAPRVLTIVKLASVLGATPNDLLAGIGWTEATFRPGSFEVDGGVDV
jgi:transcriptional regulator with XRE-family HTH domain